MPRDSFDAMAAIPQHAVVDLGHHHHAFAAARIEHGDQVFNLGVHGAAHAPCLLCRLAAEPMRAASARCAAASAANMLCVAARSSPQPFRVSAVLATDVFATGCASGLRDSPALAASAWHGARRSAPLPEQQESAVVATGSPATHRGAPARLRAWLHLQNDLPFVPHVGRSQLRILRFAIRANAASKAR